MTDIKQIPVADIDGLLADVKEKFGFNDEEIVELSSYILLRVKHMVKNAYKRQVHFFRGIGGDRFFNMEIVRDENGLEYWVDVIAEMANEKDWKEAAFDLNGLTLSEDGEAFYDLKDIED